MSTRGTISSDQLKASSRTGTGPKFLTAASADALTQSVPLLYDSSGNVISTATRTGNTTAFVTASGSLPSGDLPKFDAAGNIIDSGIAASAVSAIFGNQTKNTIFAGPASGASAAPTFRASVVNDYPFHDEVLTDGSGNIIYAGGDVVMVVGVPN